MVLWLAGLGAIGAGAQGPPDSVPASVSLDEFLAAHESNDWARYEAMAAFLAQPDAPRAVRPLLELLLTRLRAGRPDWEGPANDACLNLSQILESHQGVSVPPAEILELIEAATDWTTVQKCGEVLAQGVARTGQEGLEERLAEALVPGLASQRSRVRESVSRTLVQLDPRLQPLDQASGMARAVARWPTAAVDPTSPPAWLRERVVVFRPVLVGDGPPSDWRWEGQVGSLAEGAAWMAAVAGEAGGRYRIELVIQLPWVRVREPWVEAASAALGGHGAGLTVSSMGDVFLPVWPPLLESWRKP